ncbi:hypothetical protein Tco_1092548 [Tanacetum coccineum]|uniref:Uncharacterized protein n=1 Tax=Tanacetum coccineum TaxID=301880 RepID=A0ABQ5IAJ0_9ASTR
MSADVARGHGGDGGSDDRPPPYQAPTGCGGCLGNRGKGTRKPNLGGSRAGRMHTRQETQNLGLKAITDKNGPVPIRFEFGDRETLMPLGEHAAHWANYLRDLVRELPLYYPSWRQMPPERKAGVVENIRDFTGTGHGHSALASMHTLLRCRILKRGVRHYRKQVNMFMKIFRSDDKFSQMLTQLESHPEYGGGSGSGGCEDDDPVDDEDDGEDGEDEMIF